VVGAREIRLDGAASFQETKRRRPSMSESVLVEGVVLYNIYGVISAVRITITLVQNPERRWKKWSKCTFVDKHRPIVPRCPNLDTAFMSFSNRPNFIGQTENNARVIHSHLMLTQIRWRPMVL
ncbi:hypothetical protein CRM22_011269, partial [Opisthorchis felineus]